MKCKTLQKIVRGTLDLKTGYDFFRKLREACVCVAEVKITRRIYGDIGSDFVRISKKVYRNWLCHIAVVMSLLC